MSLSNSRISFYSTVGNFWRLETFSDILVIFRRVCTVNACMDVRWSYDEMDNLCISVFRFFTAHAR